MPDDRSMRRGQLPHCGQGRKPTRPEDDQRLGAGEEGPSNDAKLCQDAYL